ncbi:hypothetical protein I552_5062 [Mycobacterium xenopi 3993]|nr:hypothetical protein I552_5062 [Mycobacterium xenopi 3993]
MGRSRLAAARLVAEGAAAVVVDCETSYVRLGLAEQLAARLGHRRFGWSSCAPII